MAKLHLVDTGLEIETLSLSDRLQPLADFVEGGAVQRDLSPLGLAALLETFGTRREHRDHAAD